MFLILDSFSNAVAATPTSAARACSVCPFLSNIPKLLAGEAIIAGYASCVEKAAAAGEVNHYVLARTPVVKTLVERQHRQFQCRRVCHNLRLLAGLPRRKCHRVTAWPVRVRLRHDGVAGLARRKLFLCSRGVPREYHHRTPRFHQRKKEAATPPVQAPGAVRRRARLAKTLNHRRIQQFDEPDGASRKMRTKIKPAPIDQNARRLPARVR